MGARGKSEGRGLKRLPASGPDRYKWGRVAVEAGVQQGWDRYLGASGQFIGMSSFGASAPAGVLMKHFGLTVDNVVAAAKELLGK